MKPYILYAFLAAGLLTAACSGKTEERQETVYESIDTVPMLITQIQKSTKLYTTVYHIHKIVTHDDVVRLKGSLLRQSFSIKLPLGSRKVAIPMDAKLKAYIDFSEFSEQNIERDGDRITIYLPDPKVVMSSSKIDQKNIKEYVGLVRAGFSDEELTGYEQQGRAAIIESIPRLGIIERAKENAARVLVPMVAQMGFREENITISFRKGFDIDDLRTIMNNTSIEP